MFDINLEEYNYNLPEELIAQHPLEERDSSRLLLYRNGNISETVFRNIHEYLPDGSLLVFNNTRVIRARLFFTKDTGAKIEVFLLEPVNPADYSISLSSKKEVVWRCLIGNLRKWKGTELSVLISAGDTECKMSAEITGTDGDNRFVRFSWDNQELTFGEIIEKLGHIPLPPYINRQDEADDTGRYQTIYSMVEGSVAAPTAGLHFTEMTFKKLKERGIRTGNLTLHVGAGTFRPVKSDNISSHEMHGEHFSVDLTELNTIIDNPDRIIAVGTTSVRTLESLYWLGVKIHNGTVKGKEDFFIGQWEPYSLTASLEPIESIKLLRQWMNSNNAARLSAETRIIIVPGYRFKMIKGMVTNFHLPKSTLLLLVSAFTGSQWKNIYKFALENKFRLLSYGDASLLLGQ